MTIGKKTRQWGRTLVCTLAGVLAPQAVLAQFGSPGGRPDPVAPGEQYHIEAAGNIWMPSTRIAIASEALGILGDEVDLIGDLGVEEGRKFSEFRLVLRPARKHKFKLHYAKLSYAGSTTITREFVFNGIRYRVGLPVESQLDWKMLRLGYEYDFVYLPRGYAGFTLDAQLVDAALELDSPIGVEFARARGPVPSIGFTGRGYVVPNASISAEVSFFPFSRVLEQIDERYDARYVDFDIYATVDFVRYLGARVGYRRFNLEYVFESDSGDLQIGGLYLGGVVRY